VTTALPANRIGAHLASEATIDALQLRTGGAGLVIGINQQSSPVTARLFRPEPTRTVLIGGVRCAQLLAFRALGLGARLTVRSARLGAWETFVRGTGAHATEIDLLPPGTPAHRPTSAARPQLIVHDTGSSVDDQDEPGGGWRATMTVREELTAWDIDALVRADLVILQPLTETEAALAASALSMSGVEQWMSQIREDMVTLVSRGTARWALLTATQIERHLIGGVARR
jgi:hypothetical protein